MKMDKKERAVTPLMEKFDNGLGVKLADTVNYAIDKAAACNCPLGYEVKNGECIFIDGMDDFLIWMSEMWLHGYTDYETLSKMKKWGMNTEMYVRKSGLNAGNTLKNQRAAMASAAEQIEHAEIISNNRGIVLKSLRNKKGLTQAKLAADSGINLKALQFYEQGYRDLNKAKAITVYKLAKALDCNMEDLINKEEGSF